jgi:protein-tyrosine phosphatase
MHQIPPHSLWIGSTGDLRDWRHLYDVGIQAVLDLAYEEPPLKLPHDLIACRFPLVDGDDNPPVLLKAAIDTLTRLLEEKFACLVCCHAGMSRSPAIAAAALARLTNRTIDECLAMIAQHHRCDVHPGLLAQIQTLASRTP